MQELQTLEITILLKCKDNKKSRSIIAGMARVRREGKEKTEQAIFNLINKGFLTQQELPGLSTRRTPVYYEITEKGKFWVNEYSEYLKA